MPPPAILLSELLQRSEGLFTLGTSVCGSFESVETEGNQATTGHAAKMKNTKQTCYTAFAQTVADYILMQSRTEQVVLIPDHC